MSRFFGEEGQLFRMFSGEHWVALGSLAAVLVLIVLFRERLAGELWSKWFRQVLGGMMLLMFVGLQLWYLVHDQWTFAASLPLQLSTVAMLLSVVLLWSRSYRLYEFVYFAGIGSAIQALFTPVLDVAFPHFWYFYFFIGHGGIVVTAWFFTIVEGYRPALMSVARTMLWLNLLLLIIIPVNWLTGGNYMFMARKPATPSILDFLGPWPWYILWLEIFAVLFCLLLYLPFARWRRTPAGRA